MFWYFLTFTGGVAIGYLIGIIAVVWAEAREESNRYDDDEWTDEDCI